MPDSVSWVMDYSRRPGESPDRLGGLPDHLPYAWPRCQGCQERMGFVGQLYAADHFPMDGHLALQLYVCDDCMDVGSQMVHLEVLPPTAALNRRRLGVRYRPQSKQYITFTPIEDSIDQWAYIRRRRTEDDLPDEHLRRDKVGGLFPYDDSEGPKITRQNRMVAQFDWRPRLKRMVYVFQSARLGFYLSLYS